MKTKSLTIEEIEIRRENFKQANASLMLEGLEMDNEDLELQEKVAIGEMDHEEAVAAYKRKAVLNGN